MSQDVPFTIPGHELTGSLTMFDGRSTRRIPYTQLADDVQIARGRLEQAGLQRGSCVGIMGENCYEWIVYDLAVMSRGCLLVCFPSDEFSKKSVEDIADSHDLSLLLVTKKLNVGNNLTWVLTVNDSKLKPTCVRPLNVKANGLLQRVCGTDACSLIFSSGTSGQLKGLLLSRKGIEAPINAFGNDWQLTPKDGVLVALPLSVFQQRLMVYACLRKNANILLTDSANLFRSFKVLQPSVILGPPALFESVERRFLALPDFKRRLMQMGSHLLNIVPAWLGKKRLRRLLFNKFSQSLGGQVRVLLTGSAPSKLSTLKLFETMGLPLFQAYGLAEVGFIAWNLPGRNRFLSVGQPLVPNSVRLADDGEVVISIRNPQAVGYFNVDAAEAERTFLPNGDIATGDLGRFDDQGYLYITGRKKSIILLQSGEKIHPESLEQHLEVPNGVERIIVLGGGDLPGLAAVAAIAPECSPDEETRLKEQVQSSIDDLNAQLKINYRITRLFITRIALTPDVGFVTRNLKIDREAVYRYFKNEIYSNRQST